MCDSTVSWLRSLRYEFEYYEPYHAPLHAGRDMDLAEPLYGNLWECESPDQEVKFGRVCRLSTVLCDVAEEFQVLPELFENLSLELGEDVMLWKHQLRYTYCEEEHGDVLESQVDLAVVCHGFDVREGVEVLAPSSGCMGER